MAYGGPQQAWLGAIVFPAGNASGPRAYMGGPTHMIEPALRLDRFMEPEDYISLFDSVDQRFLPISVSRAIIYECPLCCCAEISTVLCCGHGWCSSCFFLRLRADKPDFECPLCIIEPAPTTKCQKCRHKKIGVALACGHGWCDECFITITRDTQFTCERCEFDKLKQHNTLTCILYGAKRIDATGECVICMDRGANVILPCSHEFCEQCVSAFCGIYSSYDCPLCRQKIHNSIHP